MIEGFRCPIEKIKSVEEWANGTETEENCPPCLMAPLASMYLQNLRSAKEDGLADKLEQVFEQGDLLTIAKFLDNIKSDVGEPLRNDLRELDCFAQVHKQNAH